METAVTSGGLLFTAVCVQYECSTCVCQRVYWCISPCALMTGVRPPPQGHRRMVCSVTWSDDLTSGRPNLFSSGFDNVAIGWLITPPKDSKD